MGSGAGDSKQASGSIISANTIGTQPLIWFNHAKDNYDEGGGVQGFTFLNSGKKQINGPFVEADYVQNFHISDIYSLGAFNIIKLVGGRSQILEHIWAGDNLAGGIGIELVGSGADANNSSQSTRMDGPTLFDVDMEAGAPTGKFGNRHFIGIYAHGFVSAVRMTNVGILNSYIGIKADCTVDGSVIRANSIGSCPAFYDMSDTEIDFSDIYSFDFTDFTYFKCRGCYAHGGDGKTAKNNIHAINGKFKSYGLEIIGGKFDQAQDSCIYSTVGSTRVSSAILHYCNLSKNAVGHSGSAAIELDKDSVTSPYSSSSIVGNTFCDPGPDAQSVMDGILINNALSYVATAANTFFSCRSGLQYHGSASTISASGNVGP